MTTYATGNPVPSQDARDLLDNAENLDDAMHTSNPTWTDRRGVARPSWSGMIAYQILGEYAPDIDISQRNQLVLQDGEYWKLAAGVSLPYTTSGSWTDDSEDFVSVGDAVVRQELASDGGTALIKHGPVDSDMVARILEEWIDSAFVWVKDFEGVEGDGVNDDTAGIQAAMAYCAANHMRLRWNPGTYVYSSDLISERNVYWDGDHFGQASRLKPQNGARIRIDGTEIEGGFCFAVVMRNLQIDASSIDTAQDQIVLLRDCYNVYLDEIRISGANNASVIGAGIHTMGSCEQVVLNRCKAIGDGTDPPTGSGFLFEHDQGNVQSYSCDAADWQIGHHVNGSSVDLYSPRSERCGNPVRYTALAEERDETVVFNMWGGSLQLASASTRGINFVGLCQYGEHVNIFAPRFNSNDHDTKKFALWIASLNWQNAHKINLWGIPWGWIDQPAGLELVANILPENPYAARALPKPGPYSFKITDLADNTPTDVFTVTELDDASPFSPTLVEVTAFASFNGYGRAIEKSIFILQDRSDTDAFSSTKQIIAEVRESDALNFAITSFAVGVVEDSDSFVFQITSDFSTAVLSTMPEVYFEVDVIGNATFAEV